MKVTVKPKVKDTILSYPALVELSYGTIVFMCSRGCGTVVRSGLDNYIGEYSSSWQMTNARPFQGTVTLEN